VLTILPFLSILLLRILNYSQGVSLNYSEIIDLLLDNLKKIAFPEEWLDIDLSLSKQELFAMMLMNRYGEIIMSQVADYVNISMSTATGIIDRLVKNGYCDRRRSESDRRIVVISLTDKAKKIIDEIKTIGQGYFDRIMQALSLEEQQAFTSIILKIFSILGEEKSKNIPTEAKETPMQSISIE